LGKFIGVIGSWVLDDGGQNAVANRPSWEIGFPTLSDNLNFNKL